LTFNTTQHGGHQAMDRLGCSIEGSFLSQRRISLHGSSRRSERGRARAHGGRFAPVGTQNRSVARSTMGAIRA
jgi:hypothetical protein